MVSGEKISTKPNWPIHFVISQVSKTFKNAVSRMSEIIRMNSYQTQSG